MPRASRVTTPGPPPIVLEHVSRSFGKVLAVEDLSMMAAPGSLLGVIGPSGSGKTTTIRLMLGALGGLVGRVPYPDHRAAATDPA